MTVTQRQARTVACSGTDSAEMVQGRAAAPAAGALIGCPCCQACSAAASRWQMAAFSAAWRSASARSSCLPGSQ